MIATKYTVTLDRSDPNAGGNHRKSLVRALERSLRHLQTDYVDLLWLHMRDATTPIEEFVRALDDQVRLGKVLYVGISDSPAWVAARANAVAELRGWSPFLAVQVPYSLAARDPEREVLPMAAELGLTVTPWGVLEHGVLAGRAPETLRWGDSVSPRQAAHRLHAVAGRPRVAPAPGRSRARSDRRRAQRKAARGQPRGRRRRAQRGAARTARRGRGPAARLPALLPRVERRARADLRRHVGTAVLAA